MQGFTRISQMESLFPPNNYKGYIKQIFTAFRDCWHVLLPFTPMYFSELHFLKIIISKTVKNMFLCSQMLQWNITQP